MARRKTEVWAVVRLDGGRGAALEPDRVYVQAIWRSAEDARLEAQRLNELNGTKSAEYFVQATRLIDFESSLDGTGTSSSAP